MSAAVLQGHRKAWAAKPALRQVYKRYFREILRLCAPHRPIVEVGCGCGLFREFYPEVIATDVLSSKWVDVVCSAEALPFAHGRVGNIVLIDVFHHLHDPHGFLREAARVLKPGGRLVMLEPWTSLAGYLLYRYIHHETADYGVDPARPFDEPKDVFDGNATLPRIYFDNRSDSPDNYLDRLGLKIHLLRRLPAIDWLLCGGFRRCGITQRSQLPWMTALERLCEPLSPWLALRAFVVLEKRDPHAGLRAGAVSGQQAMGAKTARPC